MKQKMLDIQHESDWSNSTQIFNEKAAVKTWFDEKNEPFAGFL